MNEILNNLSSEADIHTILEENYVHIFFDSEASERLLEILHRFPEIRKLFFTRVSSSKNWIQYQVNGPINQLEKKGLVFRSISGNSYNL